MENDVTKNIIWVNSFSLTVENKFCIISSHKVDEEIKSMLLKYSNFYFLRLRLN